MPLTHPGGEVLVDRRRWCDRRHAYSW